MNDKSQEWYEFQDKEWVVIEDRTDTIDHIISSYPVGVFSESRVDDLDRFIEILSKVDHDDNYGDNLYTWNAILIPVNSTQIIDVDYIPRRRWYNSNGDYISNPDKYFEVLRQQGLERKLAFADDLDSVRPDLGLKRLTPK